MTGSKERDGVFAAVGRVADESLEIGEAIRAGTLTRSQFESWYSKRRAEGKELVITIRDKTVMLTEPVRAVLERGADMLRAETPPRARRAHRASRRSKPR